MPSSPRPPRALWRAGRRLAASAALAALSTILAVPALAAPPDSSVVRTDTTDARALAQARRVVALQRSVEGARPGGSRAPDHARAAYRSAKALDAGALDGAARDLLVEAQALYETHHGASAPAAPLAPAELAALRGEAIVLAVSQAGAPFERPGVDAVAEAAHAVVGAQHAWYEYPVRSADVMARQQNVVRRRFAGARRRARGYFPMIERTFRRRGVPTELKYLAVVESALNPEAVSWAGAAGLWQFMPATAREFGMDSLSVHDPATSTDAAARYLRQLGRMFDGDWQLALAAYNCGPGRVGRLVRAYRAEHGETPTFWDLYDALPGETRAYVPRYIAVAEFFGAVEREI